MHRVHGQMRSHFTCGERKVNQGKEAEGLSPGPLVLSSHFQGQSMGSILKRCKPQDCRESHLLRRLRFTLSPAHLYIH